jgi:transcriptional regulator with XRE-family HTH domain
MSLEDLANTAGVSGKALWKLESIDTKPTYSPALKTIVKIVEVGLKLSMCEFICWAEGVDVGADVGMPPMPESLRQAAIQKAKTRPKGQASESKPAIHRTSAKDRRLTRPR